MQLPEELLAREPSGALVEREPFFLVVPRVVASLASAASPGVCRTAAAVCAHGSSRCSQQALRAYPCHLPIRRGVAEDRMFSRRILDRLRDGGGNRHGVGTES